jgi:[protein-PII] uridylyltransferase
MTGPGPLQELRPLKELRAELLRDNSITGTEWCRRYGAVADGWLVDLLARATGGRSEGVALVAVGGYGRGILAPGSDLDLLLLHQPKRKVGDLADAIWYPIWDSGLPLDHSVRTVKEVVKLMDEDIKVALGLLDARFVAGDQRVADEALARSDELWARRARPWLQALDQLTRARHERFGDVAFLLEPDLKEARGGTRDLHLLRSVARVAPIIEDAISTRAVARGGETLADARVELQRPTGQAANILLLQDQDAVAERLGHSDADALMAAVADAARAIAWASDDGWRRVEGSLAPRGKRRSISEENLERGVVLREGEVMLAHGADPAVDPTLALRAAAASAELDAPMSHRSLNRLAKRAMAPDGVWPADVRNAFLRLLGAGRPSIAAVEALDQQGVWMRYLPEWYHVRNRPQRNAYHRYTVDRHLVETTARAATMQSSVARPDMLLLGALLHDIGKGRNGDHTDIGIVVSGEIGERMGLDSEDVTLLQKVVRLHLLLPDVATRRDLDDPATAKSVAAAVGDITTLELLAALTEADSLSTGPAAWGSWKAGLVRRLVELVEGHLEGRPPPDSRAAALTPAETELLSTRRLELRADGERVLVAAPDHPGPLSDGDRVLVAAADRPGLLATVAGVLTLAGVSVLAASTMSDSASGMALLRFHVVSAFDSLPDWDKVKRQLRSALDGDTDVHALLERREAHYSAHRPRLSAYVSVPRVIFDNDASSAATVIEVRAPDRGPLLHNITRALADSGVTIDCALVSTLGSEAVDVFYVREVGGGRVTDPARLQRIEETVLASV